MEDFGIEVIGIEDAVRRLQAVGRDGQVALASGIGDEGDLIHAIADPEVPVNTGALQRSGRVIQEVDRDRITVAVAYGGPSTPHDVDYALVVHETHPTHAKFLERAALAVARGIEARLAAAVRDRLR